jgi:hypothetical protein
MDLGGSAGGAIALQDVLRELADRAFKHQSLAQEQQRINIAQQGANDNTELRKLDQAARADSRAALQHQQAQGGADKLADDLRIGQDLSPQSVKTLTAGDRGDLVKGPTLGSTNFGQGLHTTPNPGKGPTFQGTPGQQASAGQDAELQRQITLADPKQSGALRMIAALPQAARGGALTEVLREQAKPTTQPIMRIGRGGSVSQIGEAPAGAHFVTEPPPPSATQRGDLSPTAEANLTTKLATDWQKVSAPAREMDRQFNLMQTGLRRFHEGDKNGGSQAVLVTFQKILDPTSVVRESEYARSAEGVSMLQRMQGYAEKLASGGAGVPDSALQEMVKTAEQFTANSRRTAEGQRTRLKAFADHYHIPHELVFDDSGPAAGGGGAPVGPAAPKPSAADLIKKYGG